MGRQRGYVPQSSPSAVTTPVPRPRKTSSLTTEENLLSVRRLSTRIWQLPDGNCGTTHGRVELWRDVTSRQTRRPVLALRTEWPTQPDSGGSSHRVEARTRTITSITYLERRVTARPQATVFENQSTNTCDFERATPALIRKPLPVATMTDGPNVQSATIRRAKPPRPKGEMPSLSAEPVNGLPRRDVESRKR